MQKGPPGHRSSSIRQRPLISLVLAGNAPPLERRAADELKHLLELLFDLEVRVGPEGDPEAAAEVVIGRPDTNPAVARLVGGNWPALSDQGLLLRRVQRHPSTLLVGGGSAVAVLWAAYELGERLGVRYLHDRDVYPARRQWPGLPDLDRVMEPNLRIRCWRLMDELPHGPTSWSLEENLRFLRQMAKMKFNRVRVQLWPAQPFVHYSIRGMSKPPGTLFFGYQYPIDEDTIGLEHLRGQREFTNPEFIGADTPEELHRRAVHLVRQILSEARSLGMETALGFEPAEWPRAFESVLPGTAPVTQLGSLTIGPGRDQSMDDPLLREATATVVRAYAQTYPEVDYFVFSMPEHGHWTSNAGEAHRRLAATHQLHDIESFEELCARARTRDDYPGGGQRVERQLKSDLCSLWFLDSLIREYGLLERPGGGPDIKLVYDSVAEELSPLVAQMAPEGGEVSSFLDYTASRQLKRRDLLQHVPPPSVPASLIFTLADDNVGVLPQLATGSIAELMGLLREYRWSGFHTRYWTIGDLDPTIHLLARGSWDAALTAQQAYADQVSHICGPEAVEPALAAFTIIEGITRGLDQHGLGFGFLVSEMMTQHYKAGGLAAEFLEHHEAYRKALRLMRQAHAASVAQGRQYAAYFVGRLRFAVGYLDAAESFGATGRALRDGREAEALQHAEKACAAIREALQAYADVAADHGDLGAIAAMNEYCYRPIRDRRNLLQARLRHPDGRVAGRAGAGAKP